ncbi:hypothetical protein C8A01DRAFT_45350 [Parachaetomium inaequale]|uniref:Clr5 domain-containing protein n=1 Tax=Parachaetomium inaequale TaxID=2588326 RepID=A0AAN6PIB1_9PEZI|nr:hypothetical protein C8A01DRAFT_45350 [Parachaetomium inaequale]
MLSESVKPLNIQTTIMMPDTLPTGLGGDQDAIVVAEPLPERPMVPTSAIDWESRKQIIRGLYMDQNMILNEVIDIMITKYKFKATARMYKGQFAKWKWTKYNKSGKPGSIKPTKSRIAKKKSLTARKPPTQTGRVWKLTQDLAPLSHHEHLQYFTDEECQVETTLSAYAALISHWSERETPWRTDSHQRNTSELFLPPQDRSILQHVRSAQDCFLAGRPQQGGDLLRRAFLGIETAISSAGGLDVEALWDCCLAVPQLVLTTGWTDLLAIFARYLHQYTAIKLPPHHPLTRVAASLHRLSSSSSSHQSTTTTTWSSNGLTNRDLLETFVLRAWHLWIDCVSRVRGRHDDVAIHLKRGYVTLVDPRHAMAGDIIRDFGLAVQDSLDKRGAFATTARILELENLLVRMYLPLFTPAAARRAEEMLAGVAGRIWDKPGNRGRGVDEWAYVDRIAEYGGEGEKAALYRRRCLDAPRDVFWLQTAVMVESRLRAEGVYEEADLIQGARLEAQGALHGTGDWEGQVVDIDLLGGLGWFPSYP